jgi:hypothetical protein|tara:strand:+ start:96 stop:257 length:162 start_codon:yes stop_codon:yes gene_type:complete
MKKKTAARFITQLKESGDQHLVEIGNEMTTSQAERVMLILQEVDKILERKKNE